MAAPLANSSMRSTESTEHRIGLLSSSFVSSCFACFLVVPLLAWTSPLSQTHAAWIGHAIGHASGWAAASCLASILPMHTVPCRAGPTRPCSACIHMCVMTSPGAGRGHAHPCAACMHGGMEAMELRRALGLPVLEAVAAPQAPMHIWQGWLPGLLGPPTPPPTSLHRPPNRPHRPSPSSA